MPTVLDCRDFDIELPGARLLFKKLTGIWYVRPANTDDFAAVFTRVGIDPSTLDWSTMNNVWLAVLRDAAKLGNLLLLIQTLSAQMNAPGLLEILDELPQLDAIPAVDRIAAATPKPFDGRLLTQRRPFLDRDPIRTALTDLSSAEGARVLVVDGPSGSGRSHIWFLVMHGCSRLGLSSDAAVRIQPSGWAGEAWGPLDLMNEIAERLEWPIPTFDPLAQPDTHVRLLLRWFRTNATKVTVPRWLVIDDVSSEYLTEAGQRMVAEIANAAATDQAGQLRIVLLGFSGLLANEAEQTVYRENIVYLDADALRHFFHELAALAGEDLESEATELLLTEAAGNPPYSIPLPFRTIGAGIVRVADRYLQTAGNR